MAPLPQYGPQRSGLSAGTMLGFTPHSFPPRKRGPRNRDDAAVMERTSAQRTFRRHDVRAHFPFVEKSARSLLRSP